MRSGYLDGGSQRVTRWGIYKKYHTERGATMNLNVTLAALVLLAAASPGPLAGPDCYGIPDGRAGHGLNEAMLLFIRGA